MGLPKHEQVKGAAGMLWQEQQPVWLVMQEWEKQHLLNICSEVQEIWPNLHLVSQLWTELNLECDQCFYGVAHNAREDE